MKRGLQYRRNKDRRAKARAKRMQKLWSVKAGYQPGEDSSAEDHSRIGYLASTGCRPCSCSMCASDDTYPTRQEARARVNENEQRNEVLV